MITVENIYKSFKEQTVLKGVNAVFEDKKVNLIIGRSGSGKTVLLKCLLGLYTPDEGSVFYDGKNYRNLQVNDQMEIRKNIGVVFQGSALFDSMNVEENVAFPIKMFSKDSKLQIQNRVDFILDRVGLQGAHKKLPSEISGGMKKRVAIARAIVMRPKYLFCDEPNSGLDPQTGTMIDRLLMEITKEFKMVTIINTHDMNSVMDIGENIVLVYNGKAVWNGSSQDLIKTNEKNVVDFVFNTQVLKMFRERVLTDQQSLELKSNS